MPQPPESSFCDVVIPRTRLDALTYRYDRAELPNLAPGDCVQVPLRCRPAVGIVVRLRRQSPVPRNLPVTSLLRPGLVGSELVGLARWVGTYYFARAGEVMSFVLPRRVERHELKPVATVPSAHERSGPPAALPTGFVEAARDVQFGVWVSCPAGSVLGLTQEAVAAVLRFGSALVLAPEPLLAEWRAGLREQFGQSVVEYHSGLKPTLLRKAWLEVRERERMVVLGVRSAVFVPAPDLRGCVIVDDHHPRYKEDRRPRFHARDVAVARAQLARFPVLIAGETPALETWHNCRNGRYQLAESPGARGQSVRTFVVDMRMHRGELFSPRLVAELRRAMEAGRSAVLHVNRRGLSRYAACRECGEAVRCSDCGMPLVLERSSRGCRYCGSASAPPERCRSCGSAEFDFRAAGVEMVVRELRRLLGDVAVAEVVSDSKAAVATGLVVGTNALLGREWPSDSGLVAAVDADAGMALPDFRARERAFHALWALCRRGEGMGARVVVQTRRPEDVAVRAAVDADAVRFLDAELEQRRELDFPPFSRLALITFNGRPLDVLEREARAVARSAERGGRASVLGPVAVQGRVPEVRLLVRLPRDLRLARVLSMDRLEELRSEWRVDVDPLDLV